MPIDPGTHLGPYEVLENIGSGGMGDVYRARDTRLGRDVAIKVSSERFSDRFSREAMAVAALNHPHVCTLHDVGPDYLVMEYVEGRPLSGPLPLRDVLKHADQIAAALEHAHAKGIVHRDLKPANILLTKEGIKLLDFGLAKFDSIVKGGDQTIASKITTEGVILGTIQYMAPEQLEGRDADERSDIFSFGCVLYELVTGKSAFAGTSAAAVIAAIVHTQPEVLDPPALGRVIQTCLAKDPAERWQSVRELRHALRWAGEEPAPEARPPRQTRGWIPWTIAGVFGIAAAAMAVRTLMPPAPAEPSVMFEIDAPAATSFNFLITASAVSPDGRYVVFRAAADAVPALWLRPLNALEARRLPGTEGGDFPFWSPDSTSIGFFSADKLRRLDLVGGAAVPLSDTVGNASAWGVGGTWNRDGVILFGDRRGLLRIAATGGAPVPLLTVDPSRSETGYGYPEFLPDGKHFLFFAASTDAAVEGIYAASLDDPGRRTQIVRTTSKAIYAPPLDGGISHLLFLRDRSLVAQPFDAAALRLTGTPVPLVENVAVLASLHGAAFWASTTGTLAYRSGLGLETYKLTWINRDGRPLGSAGPDGPYWSLRISPDGARAALSRLDPQTSTDIWVLELGRDRTTRVTFDPRTDTCPVWSPDGRRMAFSSDRTGVRQIYIKDAVSETRLTDGPGPKCAMDWSSTDRLLYSESGSTFDIRVRPPQKGGTPVDAVVTPFDETDGQFSPDGKWIAYTSNESGRAEVYVTAAPGVPGAPAGKWQVSNQGGRAPRWRGDGKELFYVDPRARTIMAADIRVTAAALETGTPHALFRTRMPDNSGDNPYSYDVTPDGQRFLVEESGATASNPLTILLHWQRKNRL